MKGIFQSYGKYYDIIYADKDYEKECDFLEEIFRKFSKSMPKTILDAGCGTGSHAIPLAKRGYEVTGIDASEVLINIAREKAGQNSVNVSFDVMDLHHMQLNKKFDTCICMFNVIGYIIDNKNLSESIFNIRKCLKNDSLFIFDFWYGPAVLTITPSERMKIVEKKDIRVIRFARSYLDTLHHICKVNYHLIAIRTDKVIEEIREEHVLRFFFPEEIKHYLEESGFKLLKFCPFLDQDAEPNEKTWNVTAISQAI